MHGARHRYVYRNSVARHVYTYLLLFTCLIQLMLVLLTRRSLPATAARVLAHPGGVYSLTLLRYRLLLQKLENQLRLLIGLRQDRDAGLLQHVGLGQFGRFGRKVRILNRAA